MGVCGCVYIYIGIYKLRNIHCPCRGSNAVMEEAGRNKTHGTWGMERPGVKRGWKIPYKYARKIWGHIRK